MLSDYDVADARDALGEAMNADDVDVGDYLRLASFALIKLWGIQVYNAAVNEREIVGGARDLIFTTRIELFWASDPGVTRDDVLFATAPQLTKDIPPMPIDGSFLMTVMHDIAYNGDASNIWRLSSDARAFLELIWSTAYVARLDFWGIVSKDASNLARETFEMLGGTREATGSGVVLDRSAAVNINNADVRKLQRLALAPDAVELSQLVARNRDDFRRLWGPDYTDRIAALLSPVDRKLLITTARLLQAKARLKIRGEDIEPALLNALTRDDQTRVRAARRICEGMLRDTQRAILQSLNERYPPDSAEKATYVTAVREIARRRDPPEELPESFIGDTVDAQWRSALKSLIVWELAHSDHIPSSRWTALALEAADAYSTRSWSMADGYSILTNIVTPSSGGYIDNDAEWATLMYISMWASRRKFAAIVPETRIGAYAQLSWGLEQCKRKQIHLKAVAAWIKKSDILLLQIDAIERKYRAPEVIRGFVERAQFIACDAAPCGNEAQYSCGGACRSSKRYCSTTCQARDWTYGGHQAECPL